MRVIDLKVQAAKVATAALLVGVSLVAGCSNDKDADGRVDRSSSTTTTSDTLSTTSTSGPGGTSTSVKAAAVDARRAIEIALAEAPGGAVVELDEHKDKTPPQWEVVVLDSGKGIEFRIDLTTGGILSRGSEGLDPEAQRAPAISAQKMIDIALADTPGELVEADLDTRGDVVVWEVEVRSADGTRHEFQIDATTGQVL